MALEIAAEYASSLADLTVNSKPLINMLTILAEENQEHAGIIVQAVENHLDKVRPEIKLPVLYLVDSIIKNVGGPYLPKFSQTIVSMFTKTFKQVDEKTRSQMFKLRETWNDVFPANKLYQLDVKVSLIDPAWPIQAQAPLKKSAPNAPVIHLNPHFQKKAVATAVPTASKPTKESEEDMVSVLARKKQELLLLQRKKIEMQLEATRRALASNKEPTLVSPLLQPAPTMSSADTALPKVPVQQRLGPPVSRSSVPAASGRIAPVSNAMLSATRRLDPRLARLQTTQNTPQPTIQQQQTIPQPPASVPDPPADLFDIKPLQHVIKRKNAITIDVKPDRDPRRRDPRLKKRPRDNERLPEDKPEPRKPLPDKSNSFHVADAKKVSKLPPIPKIKRVIPDPGPEEPEPSNAKRRKDESPRQKDSQSPKLKESESPKSKGPSESPRQKKTRRKDGKDNSSSPDKNARSGLREKRAREVKTPVEVPEVTEAQEPESENKEEKEPIAFKELRPSSKERNYMRRNREKSESPDPPIVPPPQIEPTTVPDVLVDGNKDVDLRVLTNQPSEPASVARKRPSTEVELKTSKKNKSEKFDILFGDEDVDLRTLPQVEEAPAPPVISKETDKEEIPDTPESPDASPRRKSWAKVKEPKKTPEEAKSQLDLVRAKLAEATKGKDRLGRPLLYNKDNHTQPKRRNSSISEDTDMRFASSELDTDNDRESIKIIMSQAEEQLKGGNLNPEQFNHLVMQVLQLNERQKLKEAKQRESLEVSKRKLQKLTSITSDEELESSKKDSPSSFGDIDERVLPARPKPDFNKVRSSKELPNLDSDLRVPPIDHFEERHAMSYGTRGILPHPQRNNFPGNFPPRLRGEEFGPRMRQRGPGPYFRGRMPFDRPMRPLPPRMPPPPVIGMTQGECPLAPYIRSTSPPPLGTTDLEIPPTDFSVVEYIERDPMKTIDIDGVPREIRFYGRTAIAMMDWDDPREITFLPGRRRITFDGKDTYALNFNEDDIKVNVDGKLLKVGFGRPTRELYVEDAWFECFFGGPPAGIIVDGKVLLVHLAGPPPQVDIGKVKRTDIVAGKINMIIDAVTMCPVFLDAKPQKVEFEGQVLTIRFVDSLQTVLINEKPFKVEYGGLPKPIIVNNSKHFIRFSVLPRNVRPGQVAIANMEGKPPVAMTAPLVPAIVAQDDRNLQVHDENSQGGLDMLASLMPSSMAPASQYSGYSVAEPLQPSNPGTIPGLDTPVEETPPQPSALPFFGSINVNDLFAKLVATGIVQPSAPAQEKKEEKKEVKKPEKPKEDKTIRPVDLLKPETLRVRQSGIISLLYTGMQCSGCGARFPPEQTVRYSQHLDWHFRQNRRERDSARRAHSRNWHYDLSDWIQYEEIEDLEEREKSWFESQGFGEGKDASAAEGAPEHEPPSVAAGAPADAACALCGDKFDQFYNEDKEEWHLRKAVRHEEKNYHPLCFDDYKASLAKEEPPADDSVMEVTGDERPEETPSDAEVEEVLPSDDEDVVVVDMESQDATSAEPAPTVVVDDEPTEEPQPPPEEQDESDDDDVVLKQEPVVQVDVADDSDTDDETIAAREKRDFEFNLANIKIKQEPVDPDDEPIVTAESEVEAPRVDTVHTSVTSSIDGNVQLETATTLPTGGIRINISSLAPAPSPPERRPPPPEDLDEPPPPGEEPEFEYAVKPSLQGVEFSRQPPLQKGIECSGLCAIM